MIDVLFIVLPDTLLLDLAGPAEAFRLANQALARRGQPAAFHLRYAGPAPMARSSVGLMLAELEPLPEAFVRPTWTVLLGRPGEAPRVLQRQRAWLAARQWLVRQMPAVLAAPATAPATASATAAANTRASTQAPAPAGPAPHRLMTVCVGALLAADAGLLAGRRCTTHHELLDDLLRIAPTAHVLANQVWVEDGALFTSAGITAGIDLALHCIARECGEALAASVAQVMVAATRRGAAAPQLSPLLAFRDHLHPAVHRVQEEVAERPGDDWSAEALAAVAHVTPRHLARLFRQHTGLSPRDYVEHVRAALARQAVARGASGPQAAALAGFSSDRQWRRARGRTAVPAPDRP
ncbi:GlxA family transcriptional regulator [Aquabacterium sp. OR-4]|uniref:GlxA family transcriptional regulator n=1 Tax=Aquabacterium sp. OR-4 TaxID=2978127 RepID=UPI0028C6AEDB|nr:helix-turn-helix domain-containing protein [Aquabacterium sp. OR-4]MDT7837529.1 helix-turn-helix domain-containing protein [Aquabacterium sp. OR-4]